MPSASSTVAVPMPPPTIAAPGPVRVAPRTPASAAPPDQAIDVSTVDLKSAEFKALPAAYQRAVKDAKAYADQNFKTMAPAPQVLVTPSSSDTNGGQPVTLIVPPGAKAPLTVQTHYHGDSAHSLSGTNQAADRIAKNVKAGDQTVYVLPEANKAGGAGTDWSNATNIGKTTDEALKHAGLPTDDAHRIISAHSAGGRALLGAVNRGEQLQANHLVIQDALYDPTATNLTKKLPMFQTMRVRIIAEAHLQQDQYETHPSALRVVALGRVASLAPTKGPPAAKS